MQIVDSMGSEIVDSALKVAFATTDMETVNQHFGSAKSFAIYAVDLDKYSLLEAAEFGKLKQDGNEDKLVEKINMLKDCAAVFSQAIGASAIRQLVAQGIQPLKVAEGSEIKDLLISLQEQMREGPSAWLAKAIERQKGPDMSRFDDMEAEGWSE